MWAEVLVVPFFGQGHLLPSMELCKHMASRNFKVVLVISSDQSSSIPASLRDLPLLQVVEILSLSPPPPPPPSSPPEPGTHNDLMQIHRHLHRQLEEGIEGYLSTRPQEAAPDKPLFAVVDVMMGWTGELFAKHRVPTIGFFTSGACSAALEFAMWKAGSEEIGPGETRLLPGLPEEMALTESDYKRRHHGPPHLHDGPKGPGGTGPVFPRPPGPPGPKFMGPPKPGQQPPWLEETGGSVALMFNTCADLEGPFIDYLADRVNKPAWGVGPLLPEKYWKSSGSLLHDREIRANRPSSVTEDDVIQWLDNKPHRSVLYVAFGSEVGPTMDEYQQLAAALEESKHPFIWVIQPGAGRHSPPKLGSEPGDHGDAGYFPDGLEQKVGERGLIIRGWAPQLLILSHPSTGGFLSHCGWNSTVEAVGRGVPFLTWPIRGDQYYNSKLLVSHLKVGLVVSEDMARMVKKEDIVKGIERLMSDRGVRERATLLRKKFEHGFPASSIASLDAFCGFINQRTVER